MYKKKLLKIVPGALNDHLFSFAGNFEHYLFSFLNVSSIETKNCFTNYLLPDISQKQKVEHLKSFGCFVFPRTYNWVKWAVIFPEISDNVLKKP